MSQWRALRDEFGDELHRLDSRGDQFFAKAGCVDCGTTDGARYRCQECLHGHMLCAGCTCFRHRLIPFHQIEVLTRPLTPRLDATHDFLRCGRPVGSLVRRCTSSARCCELVIPEAVPATTQDSELRFLPFSTRTACTACGSHSVAAPVGLNVGDNLCGVDSGLPQHTIRRRSPPSTYYASSTR
jgi:hypothetical protein